MDYGTPEEVLARIVWQARYKDVTCSSRAKALAIHMTDLNLRIGHGKKVENGAGESGTKRDERLVDSEFPPANHAEPGW